MVDMLVDHDDLGFEAPGQRSRLMHAVDRYLAEAAGGPDCGSVPARLAEDPKALLAEAAVKVGPSIAALQRRAEAWRPRLDPDRAKRFAMKSAAPR